MFNLKLLSKITIVGICLSSCSLIKNEKTYFGFKPSEFNVIVNIDTHGGFHGDGQMCLILDCSNNVEEAYKNIEGWLRLPLSENLNNFMNKKILLDNGGVVTFSEWVGWSKITNGVYYFYNRSNYVDDPYDDSYLTEQYSYNFSAAIYDFDTNYMHYFEYDS